ncbi:MAG TPA: hypothetical protein DCO77_05060 [Nitrospiraceae bacterium]|nr:hypothetical protein [Nitrospiraceae bacterium]
MYTRRSLLLVLAGAMLVITSACASVPMASLEMDMKAKNMSAPQDKALVYLYRNETFGSAIKMTVNLDGKFAGQTARKTYFMWLLPPGNHEFVSVTENTSRLNVDAKAGQTYYIWQEVKMGMWGARSKLQLVDKAKGKKGVDVSKLIATNPE